MPNDSRCYQFTRAVPHILVAARAMKDILENEPYLELDEAITRGLMPVGIPYEVSMGLREVLKMDQKSAS